MGDTRTIDYDGLVENPEEMLKTKLPSSEVLGFLFLRAEVGVLLP